jgi:hypothetical protein
MNRSIWPVTSAEVQSPVRITSPVSLMGRYTVRDAVSKNLLTGAEAARRTSSLTPRLDSRRRIATKPGPVHRYRESVALMMEAVSCRLHIKRTWSPKAVPKRALAKFMRCT